MLFFSLFPSFLHFLVGWGWTGFRAHYAYQAGIKLVVTLLLSANVSYQSGHFCFLMVLFFDIVYECVCVCRCVRVSAGAHGGQQRATDTPGVGVTSSYELPDVGDGNSTWVLYKLSTPPCS